MPVIEALGYLAAAAAGAYLESKFGGKVAAALPGIEARLKSEFGSVEARVKAELGAVESRLKSDLANAKADLAKLKL